ncbi:hypothetical protein BVRB_4g074480 [Beta vulgaris subsp. vulgaris]|nr:hypothetical protein BVRB_4g074480 [Beta vulgaris subsp. vulgaris]
MVIKVSFLIFFAENCVIWEMNKDRPFDPLDFFI